MAWSANRNCVFNAYRYSLGMGDINGIKYSNLKVYLTDSNFYNTNWRRIKGRYYDKAIESENQMNYNLIRLRDLTIPYKWYYEDSNGKKIVKGVTTNIYPTNLTLTNCALTSYNKESESTNTASYESLMNIPASSKIFSYDDHNNSWVTNDLDWVPSKNSLTENLRTYFTNEYNFNSAYNKTEYQSYGLSENKLTENVIKLSAESFILDNTKEVGKHAMDAGAGGLLLTYQDSEKGFTGENELPVAFYDFGKTLHSNYNFIQVDWHEDGVIKAE